MLVEVNGLAWYFDFWDYIFTRILTPEKPPILQVVMRFSDSDSDSDLDLGDKDNGRDDDANYDEHELDSKEEE